MKPAWFGISMSLARLDQCSMSYLAWTDFADLIALSESGGKPGEEEQGCGDERESHDDGGKTW